jgi:hypothetical protein
MAEELGPTNLPTGKDLSRGEVFEILVVRDDVDSERGTLEIMTPVSKAIKNSEELLIVRVIVELRGRKCPAPESDRVKFPIISKDGENARNSVVGCVHLDHDLTARYPVMEDRSSRKHVLESVEGRLTSGRPIPPDGCTSEPSERDGDARVTINEAPIKVAKTKERLNVLNLPWNGPIRDSGYFVRSHAETIRRQNVTEVLAGGDSKLAFG